jgi:hypothetical protein
VKIFCLTHLLVNLLVDDLLVDLLAALLQIILKQADAHDTKINFNRG